MPFLPPVTTVPSRQTVIDAIINYGIAQGIFTNSGDVDGIRRVSRGGIHWHFRTIEYNTGSNPSVQIQAIEFRLSSVLLDGTNISSTTINGAPRPTRAGFFLNSGPYTAYYLFNHNNCIHCIVEIIPNTFTHISLGVIDKIAAASWIGGEYITVSNFDTSSDPPRAPFLYSSSRNAFCFDGGMGTYALSDSRRPSYYPGFIRHSIGAGDSTDYAPIGANIFSNQRCRMMTRAGIYQDLIEDYTPNNFNFRSPIFPCYVKAYDSVSTRERQIGIVPGVGYVNTRDISPKAIVDNNWQVFPFVAKSTTDDAIHPANIEEGIAYLRE